MGDSTQASDLEEVKRQEIREIVNRRREAGLLPVESDVDDASLQEQTRKELVGLCLSGGGSRSASFNLGLIQALHQNGLLRQVDYLSTVSGGGYVGGCLSSTVLHPDVSLYGDGAHARPAPGNGLADTGGGSDGNGAKPKQNTRAKEPTRNGFPFESGKDGRQPTRVQELVHGGSYLSRPLLFLNRYLIGAVLINIVTFSGVLCLVSLAAYLYRMLDQVDAVDWLYALGFPGDIQRAFFPSALFLVIWLVAWAISYWRRGAQAPGRVAGWFLSLTVVSALLGGAALLGTGDISLDYLRDTYGVEPPHKTVHWISAELARALPVVLVTALLPYLRIRDLIRSGTKPKNAIEGWVFAIASRALVFGIPLLLFAIVARENISSFNEKRMKKALGVEISTRFDFQPLEFKDWKSTWNLIELQAAGYDPNVKESTPFEISGRMWQAANSSAAVHQSLEALGRSVDLDASLSFPQRWLLFIGKLVTGQENELTDLATQRVDYRKYTHAACEALNRAILRDPDFYQAVRHSNLDHLGFSSDRLSAAQQHLAAFYAEAERIHNTIHQLEKSKFEMWMQERDEVLSQIEKAKFVKGTAQYEHFQKKLLEIKDREQGKFTWIADELARVNWSMVKEYYSDQIADKSVIFSRVVLGPDQASRLRIVGWTAVLFLLSSCIVNLNAISMHGYYRTRLAEMWLMKLPGMGRTIPLARLETTAKGAPYHLINATFLLFGRRRDPSKAPRDIFTFSRAYCGSERTGFTRTEDYGNGSFDLANAIALSGAAVTPTQVQNPLLALLLLLTNSRLGQWLPNPARSRWLPRPLRAFFNRLGPVPLRVLFGVARCAETRDMCFVSDGGHYENLGLEQLLLRRCRLIIVSDATCDPSSECGYFMEVVRRVRFDRGIRFSGLGENKEDLGLNQLLPGGGTSFAQAHFLVARVDYPNGDGTTEPGLVILTKPSLTGDESVDLIGYKAASTTFPHDPTTDQFYDPDKFESYRELGFHIGERLGGQLPGLLANVPDIHFGTALSCWTEQSGVMPLPSRTRSTARKRSVAAHTPPRGPAPVLSSPA